MACRVIFNKILCNLFLNVLFVLNLCSLKYYRTDATLFVDNSGFNFQGTFFFSFLFFSFPSFPVLLCVPPQTQNNEQVHIDNFSKPRPHSHRSSWGTMSPGPFNSTDETINQRKDSILTEGNEVNTDDLE